MLSFDVRSLEMKAAPVDGRLDVADGVWQEGDPRPATAIHVTGRLSSAGAGRYYFTGRLDGGMIGECRRCLTAVASEVSDDAHFLFAEADDEMNETDDPDVYPIDSRATVLDLRPAVREHWLLAVPAYALCQEDCKGLCATCGMDLNQGSCHCPPITDNRWDALRALRGESQ